MGNLDINTNFKYDEGDFEDVDDTKRWTWDFNPYSGYNTTYGLYRYSATSTINGGYWNTVDVRGVPLDENDDIETFETWSTLGSGQVFTYDGFGANISWIKKGDYWYWYGIYNNSNNLFVIAGKESSRPSTALTSVTIRSTTNLGSVSDYAFVTVGLRFNDDGTTDVIRKGTYKHDNTLSIAIAAYKTLFPTSTEIKAQVLSVLDSAVTNMSHEITDKVISERGNYMYGDDKTTWNMLLYMVVDGDKYIQYGGTADLGSETSEHKLKGISATSEIGAGGGAMVEVENPTGSLNPASNLRKTVEVYTPRGNFFFRGEIKGFTEIDGIIKYEVEEGSRKLADSFAGIDPVAYWADVKRIDGDDLYEPFSAWSKNAYSGKMLMFNDNNLYKKTAYPVSVDGEKQSKSTGLWDTTLTNEIGNSDRLYYYDVNGISPIVVIDTGSNTVTFVENGALPDTITRTNGSWIDDGFEVGDRITVEGTSANDTENEVQKWYTITVLTALVITIGAVGTEDLTAEIDSDYTLVFGAKRDVFGMHYNQVVTQYPRVRAVTTFTIWDKDDVVWDKISLRLVARQTSLKGSKVEGTADANYAAVYIWNYVDSQYDILYQFTKDNHSDSNEGDDEWYENVIEDADNSAGRSPIFDDTFDVYEEMGITKADFKTLYYGNTDVVANDNGFKSSNIKLSIWSNEVVGITADPKMEIHYLHLEFEENENSLATLQGQTKLAGLIQNNTTIALNIDDTLTWVETSHPQSDGLTKDDEYWITDNIEAVLTNIFSAHPIFDLSTQFNGSYDEYGEISDLTYTEIYDVLQKYSNQHNWAWWYAPTFSTDVIVVADNFVDTGITITKTDILNYANGGMQYTVDTKNLRDKISVFGAENISKHLIGSDVAGGGIDYLVSHAHSLGEEHIVYRDKELYTQRNVDAYANSVVNKHSKDAITMSFTLDLQEGTDYSALVKGGLVTIETDEYSTSANSGEANSGKLFIRGYTLNFIEANGWVSLLTLYLQNRV